MNTIDTAHKYPYLLQNLSRAGGRVGWGGLCCGGGRGGVDWEEGLGLHTPVNNRPIMFSASGLLCV